MDLRETLANTLRFPAWASPVFVVTAFPPDVNLRADAHAADPFIPICPIPCFAFLGERREGEASPKGGGWCTGERTYMGLGGRSWPDLGGLLGFLGGPWKVPGGSFWGVSGRSWVLGDTFGTPGRPGGGSWPALGSLLAFLGGPWKVPGGS